MVEVEHEPRSRAIRDATLVPKLTDVSPLKLPRSSPLSPDPLPHLPPHLRAPLRPRGLPDGLSGTPERGDPGHSEEGERESEEEAGGGAGQAERRGA